MAFLLLTLITQIGFLIVARHSAHVAVGHASIAAARDGASTAEVASDLRDRLLATVPGILSPEVEVTIADGVARAVTRFQWLPPGPGWALIEVAVDSQAPAVVPP